MVFTTQNHTFLTASGVGLTTWSAFHGKQTDKFFNLVNHPITAMTVDRRQRKVVLGTSGGEVVVVNARNGWVACCCCMRVREYGLV